MAVNSMGMVYVFLYLPWSVMQPTILPQLLRNWWDVSLEIKINWNAEQSFMRDVEISDSTSLNCMKIAAMFLFSILGMCLFIYLFLWPWELITCRKLRNSNGCLSMGLETSYCLFCRVIKNIAGKRCDRNYFSPSNIQILLNILKLNEANCRLDHKTLQETLWKNSSGKTDLHSYY